MDQAQQKSEMLKAIAFARQELDTFCSSATPEEKKRRGSLEKWSASDVITHLTFWEEHLNSVLEKGMKGEKIPVAGDYFDRVNDGVLFAHIDQPFDEALAEEKAAYQEFKKFIESVAAEDLGDTEKYEFLEGRALLDRALGTHVYHTAFHIGDYYIKNGRREEALELQQKLTDMLVRFPSWKANSIYNLACFYSLNGMKAEAIEKLKLAFKEKEDLIEWSKQDSDIDPIRGEVGYLELIKE